MTPAQERALYGTRRPVHDVRRGWHVQQADGRWRLVDWVVRLKSGAITVAFADEPNELVFYANTINTRTPAEQIVAVWLEEKARARRIKREFRERLRTRAAWNGVLALLVGDEALEHVA